MYLSIILTLLSWMNSPADQEIRMEQMIMHYSIEHDSLHVHLRAPTRGWLAIGFHNKNNIIGNDLKMLRVIDGMVQGEDQFVTGFQQHPEDKSVGGDNHLFLKGGRETDIFTEIWFSIPLQSGDQYDFSHVAGKGCWVMLAYSVSDDFQHHSRMRQHRFVHL